MEKKEVREIVLYVRIKPSSFDLLLSEMKRLGYKSRSEFVDELLHERGKRDRRQKQLS